MTSTSIPAIGDVIGGRYRIQSVIASGGMGVVMRGQHVKMGRDVAVKFLHSHLIQDTDIRQRFEREVDIAKDLTHPNVVHVYDYGETASGNLFLVMEYLEGNDLKHVLKEDERFTAGRALNIMMQILDGLAEAHIRNVVHRDLKPANLFMTHDRHGNDLVKILDFGIAKSLQADQGITKAGVLCGTVAYMAPEAILAGGDTPSCDVYAAGLILLEMLTGKRAFRGETVAQTMMMQLQNNPVIPSRIDKSPLGAFIRQATVKNPEQRFRDADAMLLALRDVVTQIDPNLRLNDDEVPLTEGEASHSSSDIYKPQAFPTIPIPTVVSKPASSPHIEKNSEANTQHIVLDDLEWEDLSNPGQLFGPQNQSPQTTTGLRPTVPLPTLQEDHLRPTVQIARPHLFDTQTPGPNTPAPISQTPHNMTNIPAPVTTASVLNNSSVTSSTSLTHEPPTTSRKPLFIAIAAVLVVIAVVGGILITRGPDNTAPIADTQKSPTELAAVQPPVKEPDEMQPTALIVPSEKAAEFVVNIETIPSGADLYLANFPLGSSPVTIKLKSDELPAQLRITLEGFHEQTHFVNVESAESLQFELEEIAPQIAISEPKLVEPTRPAQPAKQAATTKATTTTKAPETTKSPTNKSAAKEEPAKNTADDLLKKYLD